MVAATEPPPASEGAGIHPPSPAGLPIKQIGTGLFELGTVRFDKNQKSLSFPAEVNMNKELIEYLVVSSSGKLHESLLRTKTEPYHIHVAMLLLGAKGSPQASSDPSNSSSAPPPWIDSSALKQLPPLEGDVISIWFAWKKGDKESSGRAEEWVFNRHTQAPMMPGNWIYTGSKVIERTFIAQQNRSIAAVITDPFAMINNPRPGHDSGGIWYVNSSVVPPVGTPVRVTIKLE